MCAVASNYCPPPWIFVSQSVPVGRAAAGEVTHIPAYKPSTGSNLAFFDAVNRVKAKQNFYQVCLCVVILLQPLLHAGTVTVCSLLSCLSALMAHGDLFQSNLTYSGRSVTIATSWVWSPHSVPSHCS